MDFGIKSEPDPDIVSSESHTCTDGATAILDSKYLMFILILISLGLIFGPLNQRREVNYVIKHVGEECFEASEMGEIPTGQFEIFYNEDTFFGLNPSISMICFVIDSSSSKKQDDQMDYEVIEETPTWQLILGIQQSAVKDILFVST